MKKTVLVRQTASPIRKPRDQRATLIGLGLNKMNKVDASALGKTGGKGTSGKGGLF